MNSIGLIAQTAAPAGAPDIKLDPLDYPGLLALLDFNDTGTYVPGTNPIPQSTELITALGDNAFVIDGDMTYDPTKKAVTVDTNSNIVFSSATAPFTDPGFDGEPGGQGELICAVWWKATVSDFPGFKTIIGIEGTTMVNETVDYLIRIGSASTGNFNFSAGTGTSGRHNVVTGPDYALDGTWIHLAVSAKMTVSGSTLNGWVNGVKVLDNNAGSKTFFNTLDLANHSPLMLDGQESGQVRRAWWARDWTGNGKTPEQLVADDYALFTAAKPELEA